ncbi:hypothetical protein E2C01_023037 [Portunus trituberculatus]|uniref:Uncharacterized protein n=1 Tax=Portunus trituberculatus TaxID=210409 RepID=A0A5B7E7S7_PORTR|nr:hypothetical protein [Portunus trituberculatus]
MERYICNGYTISRSLSPFLKPALQRGVKDIGERWNLSKSICLVWNNLIKGIPGGTQTEDSRNRLPRSILQPASIKLLPLRLIN